MLLLLKVTWSDSAFFWRWRWRPPPYVHSWCHCKSSRFRAVRFKSGRLSVYSVSFTAVAFSFTIYIYIATKKKKKWKTNPYAYDDDRERGVMFSHTSRVFRGDVCGDINRPPLLYMYWLYISSASSKYFRWPSLKTKFSYLFKIYFLFLRG